MISVNADRLLHDQIKGQYIMRKCIISESFECPSIISECIKRKYYFRCYQAQKYFFAIGNYLFEKKIFSKQSKLTVSKYIWNMSRSTILRSSSNTNLENKFRHNNKKQIQSHRNAAQHLNRLHDNKYWTTLHILNKISKSIEPFPMNFLSPNRPRVQISAPNTPNIMYVHVRILFIG